MEETEHSQQQETFERTVRPLVLFDRSDPQLKQKQGPYNGRKSTRYNFFTFLPAIFLYQFTKVTNCFYVLNAILQSTPSISINNPLASIIPLSFIVLVGMMKEAVVEARRYLQDRKINNTVSHRLNHEGAIEDCTLKEVRVGDVLQVRDGETMPADCILLKTSAKEGVCFVQTTDLDGERNLKPKLVSNDIQRKYESIFLEKTTKIKAEFISPTQDMYFYDGLITLAPKNEKSIEISVDLNMFLHRGAVLRNSGSVYALVTQTGTQTKIIMNQGSYKLKVSKIERWLNYILLFNLVVMLIMGAGLTLGNYLFNQRIFDRYTYLFTDQSDSKESIAAKVFFSFYLMLNGFVPLDLVISIELGKLIMTPFFECDVEMIEVQRIPSSDGSGVIHAEQRFEAHTLNLHEDLAEVEYIFTDKTGTLTQNELVFK